MAVSRNNAVIAMQPNMHSRDMRVRVEGPVTVCGATPKRAVVRLKSGNYVGSSKSMEAEGTREIFDQLGNEGRSALH